MNSNPYVTINR